MASAAIAESAPDTLADVLHLLGDVPPERVLARPAPGTATEEDLVRLLDGDDKRLCELIDGVLVEKTMGLREAILASYLNHQIDTFLDRHDFGITVGADGPFRLFAGHIRMPDLSFVAWDQVSSEEELEQAIADLAPKLAAEVLSKSNTTGEIERKLDDFFNAGVELVWIIDPVKQVVDVYTSRKKSKRLTAVDTLDGGRVLPGFRLPLKKLFAATKRRKK